MNLITRTFGIEAKASGTARSVRVVASSAAIDSYDEIVEQSWDLRRYRANPVVLYGHNRSGFLGMGSTPEASLPVGYASDVAVRNGRLEATLNFVDEKASPLADKILEGFRQGSIRAVSVGFAPSTIKTEMRDGKEIAVLSGNELFEISVVPLPANPESVALSAGEAREQRTKWLAAEPQAPLFECELEDGRLLKLSTAEVRRYRQQGKLDSLSVCRAVGTEEWRWLRDVPELSSPEKVAPTPAAAKVALKPNTPSAINARARVLARAAASRTAPPAQDSSYDQLGLIKMHEERAKQVAAQRRKAAPSLVARSAMAAARAAEDGNDPEAA